MYPRLPWSVSETARSRRPRHIVKAASVPASRRASGSDTRLNAGMRGAPWRSLRARARCASTGFGVRPQHARMGMSLGEVQAEKMAGTGPQQTPAQHIPALDSDSFPILNQKVHDDRRLVYLDSAATSQKPIVVLDALRSYYTSDNSNVHRGAHSLSARATARFESARDKVQHLLHAPSREEIIYTRNATEAINLVAYAWAGSNLQPGDVIVSSVMEHHSNLVPWQIVAKNTGARLRHVGLNEHEMYDLDSLKQILSEEAGKVKLVTCNHVSNMLGCVNPVREIAALAAEAGAKVMVDGCQSVPHMPVDVAALGCDFYAVSGHKMCAPTGIGILYARKELLESMNPFMGGGEMIDEVHLDHSTWAMLPHKFEAGTPSIGEAVGLGAAVDYLNQLGIDEVHAFEQRIGRYLYDRLSAFKQVKIYGPHPDVAERASLCSFNVEGVHPSDLATMMDLDGVAVRSGHHCTQPLHRHFSIDASARASLYVYNSSRDVDAFIESLVHSVELLGERLTSVNGTN
ncbi:putative cysteine desulfurase [Porphyridium purpureum]|uniref:cysteine desulfurase n=1 Tax=Porphyridium purpureum TaxID=35688 RepID=A0A5J4YI84_PORPP|nr:putative cysteine desulfurase [Porphyridium purpureum]|eukprot:POR5842..scf261_15